jgi:hypothetical protein
MSCPDPGIDAWIDGEGPRPAHLDSCGACRREADARRRLRERLRALVLPAPAALRRRARAWPLLPAAAAALVVLGLFLVRPTRGEPVPELVARASDFHDHVLRGDIRPEQLSDPDALSRYFRERLRFDVVVPTFDDGSISGACCCDIRGRENASPYILYRVRGVPLSLLVVETALPSLPAESRRVRGGQEYFVFRRGVNTVVLCSTGSVCHIWTSALPEGRMLETILATSVGRRAFSGERLTLSGVT